ncbi:hypothetical protein QFC21_005885 [Naganishia friedmannii]|uniref:Uncharacterized protein n=1 Tax=Naganishia friedmannii TaxID=89922 RepID=A0ACC2V831_9TREE|nr:hypothetical protein QFC21_005885 [Naganishia friedmannii]
MGTDTLILQELRIGVSPSPRSLKLGTAKEKPIVPDSEMDVHIRPAKTAKECDLIGEMHYVTCQNLTWFRHVDAEVDPSAAKRFESSLATAIRKQYHGIVLVAEKEGKMVGYLTAWQYGRGSKDPYRHKSVETSLQGRHLPIWWSVHSQVNESCRKIEAELGTFLYIDKLVVLPGFQKQGVGRKLMQYTKKATAEAYNLPIALMSAPESLLFFEKLGLKPAAWRKDIWIADSVFSHVLADGLGTFPHYRDLSLKLTAKAADEKRLWYPTGHPR